MKKKVCCPECQHSFTVSDDLEVPTKTASIFKIRRVIEAYKHAKSVQMDDKNWDAVNFARYSRAAKSLLTCFGDDMEKAAAYIFLRQQALDATELDWTLETIVRHAYDRIGFPKEINGSEHRPLGTASTHGDGRSRETSSSRAIAGEALRAIEHASIRAEGNGDMDGPEPDSGFDEEDIP